MALNSMQDLFVSQLKDVYSAETQLTKALPKMAKAASHPALAAAFEEHLEETRGQIDRLDEIFEMLDEKPRGKTCKAMQGLIEEGKETMDEDGEDAVIDAALIADAQRVEHYEISAYGTLKTLAALLGHDDAVALLEETLEEEKACDEKLTAIAESEVNPMALSTADEEE